MHLWYIPFFIFTLFLAPLGIFYIGVMAKNKKWLRLFIITMGILFFLFYKIGSTPKEDQDPYIIVFLINWFFVSIYLCITAREYLISMSVPRNSFFVAEKMIKNPAIQGQTGSNRAEKFIADLQRWGQEVESEKMKEHLDQLIKLSVIVMKKGDSESERFFERYETTMNKILHKYDEIENTGLDTVEIKETMANIEASLEQIVTAFQNEVSSMYKFDLLNINAETSAFLQDLRNRGLLENNNQ